MSEFHSWQDQCLWPSLKQSTEQDSPDESEQNPVDNVRLTVELVEEQASMPPRGVPTATVIGASSLTAAAVPEKRHLSLQLAPDITYRTGDYCAIVPSNPSKLVNAVMARFDLPDQSTIKLSSVSPTFLPLERPISARELFTSYVELSQPATKRNIRMLMSATQDESIKSELETLLNDRFQEGITDQRVSLLHLLQRYPTIQLPVASYISTLMPMLARLYSISSSPLKSSTCASLTYSVLHEAAKSGDGEHIGVASNYLARLQSGDMVEATIRSSHFRLPEDPAKTPVIMIAAGTGIAPFRGFVEERSAQIKRGQKLAHAVLYYGCHHPEEDDLYRAEMSAWEAAGVVSVKRAYSRAADRSNGMVHIDEVVRADSATFARLWRDGARIYVCGSRGLGISVKAAVFDVVGNLANSQKQAVSEQARDAWFDEVCRERYVADVFD
jgi:cytochrome P450/NADPH-cytochrome P450 reductase